MRYPGRSALVSKYRELTIDAEIEFIATPERACTSQQMKGQCGVACVVGMAKPQ